MNWLNNAPLTLPFVGSQLVRRADMNLRYVDSIIQVRYLRHTVKTLNNLYEAVASDKSGRYVLASHDGYMSIANNNMEIAKVAILHIAFM